MITIKNINGKPENIPEGKFYAVTNDNENYYYFETKAEHEEYKNSLPVVLELNWKGLKTSLFYSTLFQRAVLEYETINHTIFSALTTTLSDGVNGNAKEQTVLSLINKLNMTFSEAEKAELNGYFETNNFTIRL